MLIINTRVCMCLCGSSIEYFFSSILQYIRTYKTYLRVVCAWHTLFLLILLRVAPSFSFSVAVFVTILFHFIIVVVYICGATHDVNLLCSLVAIAHCTIALPTAVAAACRGQWPLVSHCTYLHTSTYIYVYK